MYDPLDETTCCECGDIIDETHYSNEVNGHHYCDDCFLALTDDDSEEEIE